MKALCIKKTITKMLFKWLLIFGLACGLLGCGETSGVVSSTRIGQLTGGDSISSFYYVTETHSGNTNSAGEFVYEPGENISFYNGDILIGKTKAMDVISTFSLTGERLSSNVLND